MGGGRKDARERVQQRERRKARGEGRKNVCERGGEMAAQERGCEGEIDRRVRRVPRQTRLHQIDRGARKCAGNTQDGSGKIERHRNFASPS